MYKESLFLIKKVTGIFFPLMNRICRLISRQYNKGIGGFGTRVLPFGEKIREDS